MPTVHALRNEVRLAVDRYERIESTPFTKESLAAICAAVDREVDDGRLPSKARMRADVLRAIGHDSGADPGDYERPFRKAELEAIATALREE